MPAFDLVRPSARKGVPKGYIGTVTGPTSYATGGFSVTIADLESIDGAVVIAGGGYKAEVTWTANKLTIVVRYFDYPAAAAGVAIEVPAGTDLSGVTFIIIAIGG